jgi:PAS domain S-box-containing protein
LTDKGKFDLILDRYGLQGSAILIAMASCSEGFESPSPLADALFGNGFKRMSTLTIIILILILVPGLTAAWLVRENTRLHARLKRLSRTARSKHKYYQDLESHHQGQDDLRQRNEEKLRSYLQLMDTLINTIPNPIFFKDGEGVFRGCNQAFAKQILGLTRDRIIGCRPDELAGEIPDDLAACLKRNGRHHSAFEAEIPCADGRRRDFLFSTAPVSGEGAEKTGSVGVMLDLTEKNRAARDRAQKEKFQGVLETAGAVCHELNQPLQVISGYAELMLVELNPDEKHYGLAQQILAQVERIADITGKLQKITRYKTLDYGRNAKIIDIHQSSGD